MGGFTDASCSTYFPTVKDVAVPFETPGIPNVIENGGHQLTDAEGYICMVNYNDSSFPPISSNGSPSISSSMEVAFTPSQEDAIEEFSMVTDDGSQTQADDVHLPSSMIVANTDGEINPLMSKDLVGFWTDSMIWTWTDSILGLEQARYTGLGGQCDLEGQCDLGEYSNLDGQYDSDGDEQHEKYKGMNKEAGL